VESDQLYPRIGATGPTPKRDMLWHDLLDFGEMEATPIGLAARLVEEGKATGTVEGCAKRLMPLLSELVYMVGKRRTERVGERFKAFRMLKVKHPKYREEERGFYKPVVVRPDPLSASHQSSRSLPSAAVATPNHVAKCLR